MTRLMRMCSVAGLVVIAAGAANVQAGFTACHPGRDDDQ